MPKRSMSRHNDAVYFSHMRDFALAAMEIAQDKQPSDLASDRVLRYALLHTVTVLGEAASKVSLDTRQHLSDIPWRAIVGTRNHLIHGYDIVNLNLLWETITHDLPALVSLLERHLSGMPGDSDGEGPSAESQ